MRRTKRKIAVAAVSLAGVLGGTILATPAHADDVKLTYWLWDSNQLPVYKQCAEDFTKANPTIKVEVIQKGWDDYWTGLTTAFASDTAPDVFTDHLAKYPEFANNGTIVDLAPLIAKDKVDTNQYYPGLFPLWGKSGKQYGLPKDWDTVGVVYNLNAVKKAGLDPATFKDWTWDAKTGGSFEAAMKKLTVDDKGKTAADKTFNKKKVKQFGYAVASGGAYGQTEWSHFAVSNGFSFNDGPWSTKYNYDSPKLAEAIQWLSDLSNVKSLAPKFKDIKASGADTLFKAGKTAMITDGSWNIGTYSKLDFPVGFAPLPKGPVGRRSMFNGLADSIWKGSKNQDAAWSFVKFLSSADCEVGAGKAGAFFPAIKGGVDNALATWKGKGVDITAFTDTANEKGATFLFPITDNASAIADIMTASMEKIRAGGAKAAVELKAANDKVNATFK